MAGRLDTPPLRLIRFLFFVLFFGLVWGRFGWGVALAAGLVFAATGVQGERRPVFVPVPGSVRILIELLYILLGVVCVFQILGLWWGVLVAVIETVLVALSSKRYRHLASLK